MIETLDLKKKNQDSACDINKHIHLQFIAEVDSRKYLT